MHSPFVRLFARLPVLLVVMVMAAPAAAQVASPPVARAETVRLFLDCGHYCDETFLKREITFVDYMRDRKDADVHVLVTAQSTGGGGTELTFKFIGLGRFAGVEQTLKYISPQAATSDELRKGIADLLKQGLVRYVSETPLARHLKVTFADPGAGAPKAADAKKDPWNLWVFRTNFGGRFNGERSTKSRSFRGSGSANRTTDDWKLSGSISSSYSSNEFELSETQTFKSISRNSDASALVVKSLTSHWSAGLVGSASKSIFLNYDFRARVAPGIEYNVFPYSQSTRRAWTAQYTVGLNRFDYKEITIFNKEKETLLDHKLGTSLSLRQPWGTASASVDFTQYLSKLDKYRLTAFAATNVRLFKGFSFNVFGEASRTRDQFNLRRGNASPEEILVRQRQLASGYSYFMNFGISYSFGSIFNNIVNPRFGGGGGDFFFFN
ncbi:MAG TPA: DUF481 domain-containing protein [Vicinamibacterales bacterium]|nr:DUF481 domain-containing protein [Vicinamibacterales bacterium]